MKTSYLDYSMSVIVGRALPDVRDGLKPVHRRILYAMKEMGLHYNKPHRKSARVVGEVLGKFHPHGDAAIYDALVRMAQSFSMRYPLIDGQGNFGSVDGDAPAAMRYTEARLSKISEELLKDIDKETVDWRDNFDGTLKEPVVLPALLPNLLLNGSTGIAVGMATEIPPHNLTEVVDAIIATIENPDITVEEIMQHIKGPDFPTGGIVSGKWEILRAYKTGKGRIKIRAKTHFEGNKIVVTELPYQVNKADLIKHIAELVRKEVLKGISDLRDESDRKGMRIVIQVKKDAYPEIVQNQLFKHTNMERTYGINCIALVDGVPKLLNIKEIILEYIRHRREIIKRRSEFLLRKAEERKHILDGFIKALDNIDEVIDIIRKSRDAKQAGNNLITKFGFSEKQAKEILAMRLQSLTSLEYEQLKKEREEKEREIEELKGILASREKMDEIIKNELLYLRETYGDERRTEIVEGEMSIDIEDLIQEEDMVIILTSGGYIKRVSLDEYRSQRRGGKGLIGMKTKEEDTIYKIVKASTHDYLLFFSSDGRVFAKKAYEIPHGSRHSKGRALVNLLPTNEIVEVLPVKEFSDVNLIFATRRGVMKKMSLNLLKNVRSNGIRATLLREGDSIVGVKKVFPEDKIVLSTRNGYACMFYERELRNMGRNAMGVRGIRVGKDDEVVSVEAAKKGDLLTVTENGYGKRTSIGEYRITKRGARGVITIKTNERNGKVVDVIAVREENEILISSMEGMMVRIRAADIRRQGRNTMGVRLMRLNKGDKVVSVTKV
ncbi:MAG: DNA gyrase subunit A [Thermoplasmata archaeon]|nr:DNA gyrase subunit A [Thermoplasmata archaeon]